MTAICEGSGYWPLIANRLPDGTARCERCGATVRLSKTKHLLAHPWPEGTATVEKAARR